MALGSLDATEASSNPWTVPTDDPGAVSGVECPPSITVQLADLMAGLDRVLSFFPTDMVHHVPREMLREYVEVLGGNFELRTTLELLLRHTQHLAALYPDVLRLAIVKVADPDASACVVTNCIHQDRSGMRMRSLSKVDYALLSLLLACHQRVLDILDLLIEHARVCSHMTAQLPKDFEPKFDIPEIRIGSFVAPKVSAASMVLSMLFELQILLIKKGQDLGQVTKTVSADSPRQAEALRMQCDVLQERAETALQELQQLKLGMAHLGLMKPT